MLHITDKYTSNVIYKREAFINHAENKNRFLAIMPKTQNRREKKESWPV